MVLLSEMKRIACTTAPPKPKQVAAVGAAATVTVAPRFRLTHQRAAAQRAPQPAPIGATSRSS
jgi:hypothetical protein